MKNNTQNGFVMLELLLSCTVGALLVSCIGLLCVLLGQSGLQQSCVMRDRIAYMRACAQLDDDIAHQAPARWELYAGNLYRIAEGVRELVLPAVTQFAITPEKDALGVVVAQRYTIARHGYGHTRLVIGASPEG